MTLTGAVGEALKSDHSRLIAMATLIFVSLLAYWFATLFIIPGSNSADYAALVISSVISLIFRAWL